MSDMIVVKHLKKSYADIPAVNDLCFTVKSGSIFAFLGPNGAGKSTTISILCTLLAPNGGEVYLDGCRLGREDDAIRNRIGVVFQESLLDPLLTVRENLNIRAAFYGFRGHEKKEAVKRAADAADAAEFLDRRYGKLSGGMRRRADIARALLPTPRVLFLDEPTTGLDPKHKEGVWSTIQSLQKKTGMTVFLTTHYMEEAADADYIVLLTHGEIAVEGTPYDLKERYSQDTLRLKPSDKEAAQRILSSRGLSWEEKNQILCLPLSGTLEALPLLDTLRPCLESFEVVHGSMEDVFLKITGGSINHDESYNP